MIRPPMKDASGRRRVPRPGFRVAGALIALSALAALVLVSACRKAEAPALVRLIDVLGRDNVIDSPVMDFAKDPKEVGRTNPNLASIVEKYALMDLGSGKNPLLLKKKVAMGPFQENALFAPPRSQFRFSLRIPAQASLEFACGLYWGGDRARKAKGSCQVEFLVRAKARGRDNVLFQRKIILDADRNLVQQRRVIDLSALAGQSVVLDFITHGDQDTQAYWFNPVIFRPRPERRNVILVSIDTLRADHLSCYGYERPTSPNIDALAADSVLFRNVYAAAPWTLPSHVSMLTGLDCINHQVYSSANRMDPGILTLADFLRQAGLVTMAFTGGGFVSGVFGLNKGFDSFFGRAALSSSHQAEVLARSAIPWIEQNASKGFFLFLHTYQVHNPYSPPEDFAGRFLDPGAPLHALDMNPGRYNHENRYKPESEGFRRNVISLYDGEITYTDEALIGALVAALKRLGLYDRTMIVVTADHGEEFFEKGAWLHTNDVYNPVLKIPLVIKFPGSRDAGKRIQRLARLTDVMPTILDELGIDYSRAKPDGRGLEPLVRGKETGPERIFRSELAANIVRNHIPHKRTISQGPYKVIQSDPYTPEQLAYFYYPPPTMDTLEVFDLAADPSERTNLAKTQPELARRLLKYLEDSFKPMRKLVRTSAVEMNEDMKEELKALGYIR